MQNWIFIFIVLVLPLGCNQNSERQYNKIPIRIDKNNDSLLLSNNKNNDNKDLACKILNDFPNSLNFVKSKVEQWMKSPDDCVCKLIDTITYYFINTSDINYLYCLDTISNHSDGYITTVVEYCLIDLLKANNICFLNYLLKNDQNKRLKKLIFYHYYVDYNKEQTFPSFLKEELKFLKDSDEKGLLIEWLNEEFIVLK